jgi:DNA-binding LacI/PurR family transcriptional regulator
MNTDKRISIKDVAVRAGVSYQTVSKILNGVAHFAPDTEERVWTAIRELQYKPHVYARNLRERRSRMIGYSWVPVQAGQVNHILDMFLGSMVAEAEAAGYHLLPFPYREGDELVAGYRQLIDAGKVDGFVLSSVNYHDARVRYLLERHFPFVPFGRAEPELDSLPYVEVDGAAGLRMATEHLLSRGRRRIAALAWPEESRVGNDRLRGYLEALQAAGLAPDSSLIARGEGTCEAAREVTSRWLDAPAGERPDGIVTLNDTMAIGALHAARERGVAVGQDLGIVGFDDVPMAHYLWPPLTSVRQPVAAVGRSCVEILVALLEGREPPERQVLLQPELIVRASG